MISDMQRSLSDSIGAGRVCAQRSGDVFPIVAHGVDGVLRPVRGDDVAHAVRLAAVAVHRQHRGEVVLVGQAEEPLAASSRAAGSQGRVSLQKAPGRDVTGQTGQKLKTGAVV